MTRSKPFGRTLHERVTEQERRVDAMEAELNHVIAECDRYADALRFIAHDPDSGVWGDVAARALRPERAPPD